MQYEINPLRWYNIFIFPYSQCSHQVFYLLREHLSISQINLVVVMGKYILQAIVVASKMAPYTQLISEFSVSYTVDQCS